MTPSQVKEFAKRMGDSCGATIISESELSFFRKIVFNRLMSKLGKISNIIPDIRPCCVPIFGKPFIVLPFEIGDEEAEYQRDVITHECQHAFSVKNYIAKYKRKGINWLMNYFSNQNFRAWEESFANIAESEVWYFLDDAYVDRALDKDAYLITSSMPVVLYNDNVKSCKEAVFNKREWIPTQQAARAAISILRDMGIEGTGIGGTARV